MNDTRKRGDNTVSDPVQKKKADPQKQQKRKTVIAALIMFVPFCFFMYMIFGPDSDREQPETVDGINVNMPEGKARQTELNKQKAAEIVRAEDNQSQRVKTLGDDPFGLFGPAPTNNSEVADEQQTAKSETSN